MTTPAAPAPASSEKYWTVLAIVASVVAAAILLRAEGRSWICACGSVQFWSGQICSANNSQHFLDPYSFTHVQHGFLFLWLIAWLLGRRLNGSWQLVLAIAVESFWEVFENTNFIIDRYRSQTAALGYNGDTVINSFGDILCCLIGFIIARRLGWRRSFIAFGFFELLLIVWIKDSLLLEILMLIIPIDAIRAWQMCG
ncbi:MAG TPA: DUF2585 family protein [Pyrinomonadaceae bacterium]|nr:DUF2585 family protein [Pyrinomonadaceae bacterium]